MILGLIYILLRSFKSDLSLDFCALYSMSENLMQLDVDTMLFLCLSYTAALYRFERKLGLVLSHDVKLSWV